MYWVNGEEMAALTGITARFGGMLPDTASATQKLPGVVPDPRTGCAESTKAIKPTLAYLLPARHTLISSTWHATN